jgi:hypothetical protein
MALALGNNLGPNGVIQSVNRLSASELAFVVP